MPRKWRLPGKFLGHHQGHLKRGPTPAEKHAEIPIRSRFLYELQSSLAPNQRRQQQMTETEIAVTYPPDVSSTDTSVAASSVVSFALMYSASTVITLR